MPSQATQSARPNGTGAAAEPKLPQSKPEDLRDQMMATPGLSGLDGEAMLTVFAAALLAESEDRYSREAALGILQRARKISPEILAAAVSKLTEQLAAAMTEFWSRFIQETWQSQDPPPQYVDPGVVAKRKELEEQEQERNRQLAAQYVDNTKVAAAALGIEEKEPPKDQVPPKRPRLKLDVGQLIHGLIYKPVPTKSGPASNASPGWLTPPLLDRQAEDVTVFDNDIMDVVGSRKLSGEQAWKKLEDRGYARPRIIQTIDIVRKTAQDQIAQCDQILSFIRTDYQTHIEPVVKAAVLIGHAISLVNSFYAPLVAEDSKMGPGASAPRMRRR
jgi:hypothetical protein